MPDAEKSHKSAMKSVGVAVEIQAALADLAGYLSAYSKTLTDFSSAAIKSGIMPNEEEFISPISSAYDIEMVLRQYAGVMDELIRNHGESGYSV